MSDKTCFWKLSSYNWEIILNFFPCIQPNNFEFQYNLFRRTGAKQKIFWETSLEETIVQFLYFWRRYISEKTDIDVQAQKSLKHIILWVLKIFWSNTFLTAKLISWLETFSENTSGPNSLYPSSKSTQYLV